MNGQHPLAEARAEQEASELKSRLSALIYQGIIDRLSDSEGKRCHADDLEPLFPPEHRDLCRRLTGAQFGSLASRHYIIERERRKSAVPSRRGAKSGVFEFTLTGREELVGVNAGGTAPRQDASLSRGGSHPVASIDPGETTAHREGTPHSQEPARSPVPVPSAFSPSGGSGVVEETAPESARLFELAPERPLSAWTSAEAA